MTDMTPVATPEDAFKVFTAAIEYWRDKLKLDEWRLTFARDDAEDAYAACMAMPKYKKALITANVSRMHADKFTPLQIESTALHEMVHAILWLPFNELANPKIPDEVMSHFEEETTEHVAESLLRARYPDRVNIIANLWRDFRVERTVPINETVG